MLLVPSLARKDPLGFESVVETLRIGPDVVGMGERWLF
jgi:hypothetical protein